MIKIAIIGAGSFTFGKKLITDLLSFPQFQENITIHLEDTNDTKLTTIYSFLKQYQEVNQDKLRDLIIKKTQDQKKAIVNAKYIVNLADIGGLDAFKLDLEIPKKYGITQCIGDTLGPGGVFRFLRSAPFLKKLVLQIQSNGYSERNQDNYPIFFNFANPMAMNTWYCNSLVPNSTIGLCHGVVNTAKEIQEVLNLKPNNFRYTCAGINHMAWFLEILYKKEQDDSENWENAYPLFSKALSDENCLLKNEKIRIDMMKATNGYFMTESSGHLSEYLPYYRKRKDLLEMYSGNVYLDKLDHAIYYNKLVELSQEEDVDFIPSNNFSFKSSPSQEDLAPILNALETKESFSFNGNIMNENSRYISNLPDNCCIEVPIMIKDGFQPKKNITLPSVISGLCISNIIVQQLAVEAALTTDREKIFQAILLDPNSASVCSPSEIREMVNEMLEAQSKWISDY